jgi:hypothetical protein
MHFARTKIKKYIGGVCEDSVGVDRFGDVLQVYYVLLLEVMQVIHRDVS